MNNPVRAIPSRSVLGRIWSTVKASKGDLVGAAKSIGKEVANGYGGKFFTKPEILGGVAGAAYGAGTADYRRGPGDGVSRALSFGAFGLGAGSAYKLGAGIYNSGGLRRIANMGTGIGKGVKGTWADAGPRAFGARAQAAASAGAPRTATSGFRGSRFAG